jgi:TRAP-type mannitol/chloroaromatic compound transport system permease small subunit
MAGTTAMQRTADRLQIVSRKTGEVIAWFTVAMVILMTGIVIARYSFASGSIRLQESITFMHAAVFMLAAAYTLAAGDHVRVDIFYSSMSARAKAIVDIAGTLLLLMPFCAFLIWSSWDYVGTSWSIRETSSEAGGLPFPFPAIVKSFIPIMATLLILQGLAVLLESLATLARTADGNEDAA